MLTYRAIALNNDAGAFQIEIAEMARRIDADFEPKAGGADLIQGDAAEFSRQPHYPVNFIFNPGHALLICAHVRGEDIGLLVPQGAGQGPEQPLADMLKQAYGNDDKTLQTLRETIEHTMSEILEYRADLSYIPAK